MLIQFNGSVRERQNTVKKKKKLETVCTIYWLCVSHYTQFIYIILQADNKIVGFLSRLLTFYLCDRFAYLFFPFSHTLPLILKVTQCYLYIALRRLYGCVCVCVFVRAGGWYFSVSSLFRSFFFCISLFCQLSIYVMFNCTIREIFRRVIVKCDVYHESNTTTYTNTYATD